jgi:hypothetical protein
MLGWKRLGGEVMKRKLLAALCAAGLVSGFAVSPAIAVAPGPGDNQCKPGQTQNPNDPPKRPPSCPGR